MLIATVSTQRSGTKLLGSCFNSGTQIRSLGEIFNPDIGTLGAFRTFLRAEGIRELQRLPANVLLNQYFADLLNSWRPVHFDVLFNQLEIPCLTWNPYEHALLYGYLRDTKSLVISLERHIVDTYISAKLSAHTGLVHEIAGVHDLKLQALDVADFKSYARTIYRHRRDLYEAMEGYPFFKIVSYEDIEKSAQLPDTLLDDIASWAPSLNRKRIQVHPSPLKRNNVDYHAAFSNISEIEAAAMKMQRPISLVRNVHSA